MKSHSYLFVFCWSLSFATGTLLAEGVKHTGDSLEAVKANIAAKKAVLVDVREESEWDAGHIGGAFLIPLSQLKSGTARDALEKLPKDKVLYTYCKIGVRSLTAAEILAKRGYTVRALKPGYQELLDGGVGTSVK